MTTHLPPPARRLWFLLPLLLFGALMVYFAVGLRRDPGAIPSALIDRPVPVFSLPPVAGFPGGLDDAQLRGRPQLLNVFASWCAPCRVEHPLLMRVSRELGIPVRAINYKDKPADARGWLERFGNPYAAIGADSDGRVAIDWGVYGVPETFVIDRGGRIRYRHVGPITPADLDGIILPLLKKLED